MAKNLEDMVALVTGASRGIGRSISLALAEAGAQVILSARDGDGLRNVSDRIASAGGRAAVIPADLGDEGDIKALFDGITERFGRLDVLVNNAGIGIWGKLVDFSMEDLDRLWTVNVRGMYLCCKLAARMMIPQKRGYIINLSSVVGFKGYAKQSAYTATKHAVMGLTKALAVEMQEHGIHVAAVLPGGVDTNFIGDARPDLDRSVLIHPEDVANTVLYLLSLSDRAWVDEIYVRRRTGTPFI
jgi:3-oxoacyl-[acyl-carrier protein] reductase